MLRLVVTLLIAACALFAAGNGALAEKRVALVIGNSAYEKVPSLPNPANDAAAMAAMFKSAGFDLVDLRQNLKNAELRKALNDFFDGAKDADAAVVYYAGHGVEVDGSNYMVPVDAVLARDRDVYDEAISLERVLQSIDSARQLRLVILDACRDNPFARSMKRTLASRAISRGLAGVEPSRTNTLIAFAARAGSTADDGDNGHSPFTTALLNHLTTPGLDLRKAFGMVRDDVMTSTNDRQEPFVYGSLGGADVTLVPGLVGTAGVVDEAAQLRRDYEMADHVGTKEAWDYFLAAHGKGYYADLAKAQRNKLAAEEAQAAAVEKAKAAEDTRIEAEKSRHQEEAQAAAVERAKALEQAKAADEARIAAEKAAQAAQAKAAEAEQARQAALSKADQDARLAAERITKLEQARRDALEQARLAREANQAEAEKAANDTARQLEEARVASIEQAKRDDVDNAAKVSRASEKMASLGVDDQKSTPPLAADIPRLLQAELRRVGCFVGSVDGQWTAAAQQALSLFNRSSGMTLDVKAASLDALDVVKGKSGRVCPLQCATGYRADGERCVANNCPAGMVGDGDGVCREQATAPPPRVSASPSRKSGKCFAFNGQRYCE
jgi:hypothetical protein